MRREPPSEKPENWDWTEGEDDKDRTIDNGKKEGKTQSIQVRDRFRCQSVFHNGTESAKNDGKTLLNYELPTNWLRCA